jgi:acetyl-CoA decarbonylase/synthase complex subunit alpha
MAADKKINIKKLKSPFLNMSDVEIEFGKVEEDWEEPMGPTPKPSMTDLREWDMKLLERYKPFYTPVCDMCCLCSFGKCDLTHGKKGACGIDVRTQQARMIALEVCIGTAAHGGHARHMLEHQIERKGRDFEIDMGLNIATEAPITRTVVGIKPKTLGDFEEALDYAEEQLQHVIASLHTGNEGSYIDYESKALHAGMIDNLVKEVGDIAQIVGYDFNRGDPEAPLVDIGVGTIDKSKPVILTIGHNVAPGAEIVSYTEEHGKADNIEICGICCTSHDLTRRTARGKIIGPLSMQTRFVRSGTADVIILDEQCVRTDLLEEAEKVKAPLIATNDKACHGLKDRSKDPADEIVNDLVAGKEKAVLILEPEKVGEVAVRVAEMVAPKRENLKAIPDKEELIAEAERCVDCEECQRACPVNLHISAAMTEAAKGKLGKLSELRDICVGCVRCESACPKGIPVLSLLEKAAEKKLKEEKSKIRVGRGPILDTEIRNVGPPIVFGEIPGVLALAGCSNYPNGAKEVAEIAEEFIKRNFIVTSSGCAAMSMAQYKDEDGESLFEKYPGDFDSGGLTNVGSCLSNAHILGAAIKIPAIFARRDLRANFEEIADYILNRVGAVALVWGTYSQKALSIGTGLNRWGIPVILGPAGSKYRRLYLGRKDKEEDWEIFNARTGDKVTVDPTPGHLTYVAESKEEAIVAISKLVMRPNDTTKGRQIKLAHYIDLHKRYMGKKPDDLHMYIRTEGDIPSTMKDEIKKMLKKKKWKEKIIPDPTLVERLVWKKEEKNES